MTLIAEQVWLQGRATTPGRPFVVGLWAIPS